VKCVQPNCRSSAATILPSGEPLSKLHHPAQVLLAKATPKLGLQLCAQGGHDLFAILGALFLENILSNPMTYVPIQRG